MIDRVQRIGEAIEKTRSALIPGIKLSLCAASRAASSSVAFAWGVSDGN